MGKWTMLTVMTEVALCSAECGTEALWNYKFWSKVRLDDTPPVIRYWGDKVV